MRLQAVLAAVGLARCYATVVVPDEDWGYVDVRPGAHMFWWLYGSTNTSVPREQQPVVIWLQGGPGGSSTGFGNFLEIGPVDVAGQSRNTSWVNEANVLFIDNPVGTGFSYVDSLSLLTTNNSQIADDLVTLVLAFYDRYPALAVTPLYVFCESYGGKMTTGFANALLLAMDAGRLKINFKGIALVRVRDCVGAYLAQAQPSSIKDGAIGPGLLPGDSWISPIDYVEAWGPLLNSFSLLDPHQLDSVSTSAAKARSLVDAGQWTQATDAWGDVETAVEINADSVSFYNMLLHHDDSLVAALKAHHAATLLQLPARLHASFLRHVGALAAPSLDALMNGPVKTKLKIIPSSVQWGGQSGSVFNALSGDFMKPVVTGEGSVDALLKDGRIGVTIYTGQLDLICCTTGTEAWMRSLTWPGMADFLKAPKHAMYPKSLDGAPLYNYAVYRKQASASPLRMYYVNLAGHMVPSDNPLGGLLVLRDVIRN